MQTSTLRARKHQALLLHEPLQISDPVTYTTSLLQLRQLMLSKIKLSRNRLPKPITGTTQTPRGPNFWHDSALPAQYKGLSFS